MIRMDSISEDLFRRFRVRAKVVDDEMVIPIDGEALSLAYDEEHGRLALWGEVASVSPEESKKAAIASLKYNDAFAYSCGVTLGVSSSTGLVILGRSFDVEHADVDHLMREAGTFARHFRSAKTWFADALNGA